MKMIIVVTAIFFACASAYAFPRGGGAAIAVFLTNDSGVILTNDSGVRLTP